jgi:DNA-binding HxlR family transcriptional regulator
MLYTCPDTGLSLTVEKMLMIGISTKMDMPIQPVPDMTECPLGAALEVVGDRWSLLILRSAFHGICHFEEFQATLGIARNILAQRLLRLTEHGILSREPMAKDRRKVKYCLTTKGAALLPALVALRQWGEKWELDASVKPLLVEEGTSQPIRPVGIFSHDGRELSPHDLGWVLADNVLPLAYFQAARAA